MIQYTNSAANIKPDQLEGFFEGWPNPPSPETHLRLLRQSDEVVLALDDASMDDASRDDASRDVVGFITAISDGVLAAYIPLLEVRRAYRGRGIGKALVRRMLDRLDDLYIVDLLCDPDLQPFYAALGMRPAAGMMLRNYEHQSGKTIPPESSLKP